jgi:hypothetical protein
MSGTELVHYDAMCRAIAAAFAIDEVKEIRDRARALEVYARQARNVDAERKACEIRLRAERRTGQLLAEREMANGARGTGSNQHQVASQAASPPPLSDFGITHTQSLRWQKLAAIPDREFEATFAAGAKPTTGGLIAAHEAPAAKPMPVVPVSADALWVWGRLLDFERMGVLDADPAELFGTMLEHMQETTRELAPIVARWLERLAQHEN